MEVEGTAGPGAAEGLSGGTFRSSPVVVLVIGMAGSG